MRFLETVVLALVLAGSLSEQSARAQAHDGRTESRVTAEIEGIVGGGTPVGSIGMAVGWLPTQWLVLALGVGATAHSNSEDQLIGAFTINYFDLQVSVMARTRFAPQGFSLNPGLGVSVGRYDAWHVFSAGSGDPFDGPGPSIAHLTVGAEVWGNGELSLDYRSGSILFRAFVGAALPFGGSTPQRWCTGDEAASCGSSGGSLGASLLPYAGLALGGSV